MSAVNEEPMRYMEYCTLYECGYVTGGPYVFKDYDMRLDMALLGLPKRFLNILRDERGASYIVSLNELGVRGVEAWRKSLGYTETEQECE